MFLISVRKFTSLPSLLGELCHEFDIWFCQGPRSHPELDKAAVVEVVPSAQCAPKTGGEGAPSSPTPGEEDSSESLESSIRTRQGHCEMWDPEPERQSPAAEAAGRKAKN